MKKNLLLLAALLSAGVLPGRAEVLIYKGSATVISTPGASFPPLIELFFVFEIASNQAGSIIFFKANGQKTQVGGTPFDLHFTTSPLPGGGTARLISSSNSFESLPSFSDGLTYFRGTQKTLTVATGVLDTTRNEPRTMKGIQFSANESAGNGSFLEGRFKLTYQEKATIAANNAPKTLPQTLDDLVAELTAKGYNPP